MDELDAIWGDPDILGLHCYDDSWAALRAGLRAVLRAARPTLQIGLNSEDNSTKEDEDTP